MLQELYQKRQQEQEDDDAAPLGAPPSTKKPKTAPVPKAPTGSTRGFGQLKQQVGTRTSLRFLNIMWTRRYGARRLSCKNGRVRRVSQ